MAQITHGIRSILSHPFVYSSLQSLMGAHKFRTRFATLDIRPVVDMKLLDIGCGPADILAHLPGVDYWGFDISQIYIDRARRTFGNKGRFHVGQFDLAALDKTPVFDTVLAIGLLHHLDDEVAQDVLRLAHAALRPGGRLLTVDPCFEPSQNVIARFLIENDRGQNVRTRQAYEDLAHSVFGETLAEIRHQAWIPYTHCVMKCVR